MSAASVSLERSTDTSHALVRADNAEDVEDGGLGYFAIVYEGGVKLREGPSLDAAETGEVLQTGDVFAASSIRHVSAELDMVAVTTGGWLVMRMGDLVAVEPVEGPREEAATDMYQIVYPNGMSFAKEPRLDASRFEEVHPAGTVVKAVKKITPPGSKVTFVELAEGLGYIFVGKMGNCLERLNGQEVLVRLAGDDDAWSGIRHFRVINERGVLIRRAPKLTSPHIGKLLQVNHVVAVGEVVRDVASKNEFACLMDGSGWIRVRSQKERFVEPAESPSINEEDKWYRIVEPEGLDVRTAASSLAGYTQAVLMPGTVFLASHQVRPAGQKHMVFARVNTTAPPFVDYATFLDGSGAMDDENDAAAIGRIQEVGEWVCVSESAVVHAEEVASPVLGLDPCWHQVLSTTGVKMYSSIDMTDEGAAVVDQSDADGGVMSFGSYFVSQRSFRPAGCPITYLQVGDGSDAEPMWVADRGADDRILVQICDAPIVEGGDFWLQVINPQGAIPRTAPHVKAGKIDGGSLAPFSVLRSSHLLRPPYTAAADAVNRVADSGQEPTSTALVKATKTAQPVTLFGMLDNGGWLFLQDAESDDPLDSNPEYLHARLLPAPPLVLVGRRRYRIRDNSASMRVVTGPHPDAPLIYLAQPGHEIITTRELRIFGDRGGVFLEMEAGKGWIILASDASIEDDLYVTLQPLPLQGADDDYYS